MGISIELILPYSIGTQSLYTVPKVISVVI